MSLTTTSITTKLLELIPTLGAQGGLISPSVYDTAQLLRRTTPLSHRELVVQWLLDQQHADGGWGNPLTPRARTTPTLAALLALHQQDGATTRAAVAAALSFLQQQAPLWADVPDDIPVAAELLIPALAHEAQADGLAVPVAAYTQLAALGDRRRALLLQMSLRPGSPLAHSWEAWGTTPDPSVVDATGGIGHNPAATATWLQMAREHSDRAEYVAGGQQYLDRAAATCAPAGPGIVPGLWPSPRNEQILSLYHLHLFGLLDHPVIREHIAAQVADVWQARRLTGFGLSDWFSTDGDLTSMAFAVLTACGYTPDPTVLRAYLAPDGRSCLSYPHELQRSRSTTAHAAHAFVLLGDFATAEPLLDYVLQSRDANNRLIGDKWHATWLYMNSHAVAVLCQMGHIDTALQLLAPVLSDQHADGGWGIGPSTCEETAYAILALYTMHRAGIRSERLQQAWKGAEDYLLSHTDQALLWYDKEIYRPYRVVRVIELAALMACQEKDALCPMSS